MSVLRVVLFAAFCATGIMGGLRTACPTATSDVYAPTSCAAALACHKTRCSCLGRTFYDSNQSCSLHGSYSSCTASATCQGAFVKCMNTAATGESSCGTALADLKMSLLSVASGAAYAQSVALASCRREQCLTVNWTTAVASACEQNWDTVCPTPTITTTARPTTARPTTTAAPPTTRAANTTARPATTAVTATVSKRLFRGSMRIGGNFTALLKSASATAALKGGLETDLSKKLGPTKVDKLSEGSLSVEFTTDLSNSTTSPEQFQSTLEAAAATSDWLTSTSAAYTANGGEGSLSVLSLGADPRFTTPIPPGQTARPTTRAATTTRAPTPTFAALPGLVSAMAAAVLAAIVA